MQVNLFDFHLPKENIALRPVVPRDSARMLVVASDTAHKNVSDLVDYLHAGDVLVFNDTKVIPGRLMGMRGKAKIQVTLHKREEATLWRVFAKPAKKCRLGDTLDFDGLKAVVEAVGEEGERTLRFAATDSGIWSDFKKHGTMPLPPYIASQRPVDTRDDEDYQTMFASEAGAVAAPTAGLHFTPKMVETLREKGVKLVSVTLHVGAGTFLPVKVEDTNNHKMHSELGEISHDAAATINDGRDNGGRIVAVGTTSLRLLESATDTNGKVHSFKAATDIFISPGYRFKAVDVLMTNFHLPKSTLFMLVSAFAGLEKMQEAYKTAIECGYRFYSYGDSSLLFPKKDKK